MKRTDTRQACRGNDAGYSLIEVIVAMSILIIGILATVPMLAFNIKANTSGGKFGYANYLAQRKLEQIRSWPLYAGVKAATSTDTLGISTANTQLFPSGATESIMNESGSQTFAMTTAIVRNGYDALSATLGNCNGYRFNTSGLFGSFYNEDTNLTAIAGSLNTGDVGEYCSGNYRGEDFKLIRVRVQWNDIFGLHTIYRFMYLAAF